MWNLWLTKHIDSLKKVQKRCYSLASDYESHAWLGLASCSLEKRRKILDLCEVYKYIHGLYQNRSNSFFRFSNNNTLHWGGARSFADEAAEVLHQIQVQMIYCLMYMTRRASRFMQLSVTHTRAKTELNTTEHIDDSVQLTHWSPEYFNEILNKSFSK